MTQVTVKELAQEVAAPVERLLQQMREAGLPHTDAGQVVTDTEKQALLAHLKSSHKAKVEEPRKITLQRKTTSTLRVAGSKTISVEVRKKKTFVKQSPEEIEAAQRRELEERRATENAARDKLNDQVRLRAEEEARKAAPAANASQPEPAAVVEAPAPRAAEPAPERAPQPAMVAEVRKRDDARRPDNPRQLPLTTTAVAATARISHTAQPSRKKRLPRVPHHAPLRRKAMASAVVAVASPSSRSATCMASRARLARWSVMW